MRTRLLATALLAASGFVPATAPAQQTDRVLVIYGTDRCPTNAQGEEIVVCARRPESERFRIPKELRESPVIAPENQAWAARANSVLDAGNVNVSGIGSCSAVGSGGWTGCYQQQLRAAQAERRQRQQAEAARPTP